MNDKDLAFDAVIVGSGFGGCMTAKKLVEAGWTVAMVERGEWVTRNPENWGRYASIDLTPHYDKSLPYQVTKGGNKKEMGVYSCVGGPSVFYGGVSFRFREKDFTPPPEIIGDSQAEWPISYDDLSPYYDEAERILNIAGESGIDPTEPKRNIPFPQTPGALADISKLVKNAAEKKGLKPFHLPLAINYEDKTRQTCEACTTCDTFACAIEAKNDLPTMIIQKLIDKGMTLFHSTIATNIEYKNGKATSIVCQQKETNTPITIHGKEIIISAGALASPHLILNSGLDQYNPAGNIVGKYLMRHVNAIIFGIFPGVADKQNRFHKQLAIMDYYFGHKDIDFPKHKLGSLQQIPTPPPGLVENEAPPPLGKLAAKGVRLLTGLLAIAEDQPQFKNGLHIDASKKGKYNMATPYVYSEYSPRDLAAIDVLSKKAKEIMKGTGSWLHYIHHIKTFSHAVGTIRMGNDPSTSPLDPYCQFRGVQNLSVIDASFMPTSAAVNPSLTISANALRVADYLISK